LSCPFVIQLNRKITNNYKHCFNSQVKLVRANLKSEEFKATYNQTCAVFAKYQMCVHKDRPDECDEMQVRLLYISATNIRLDKRKLCNMNLVSMKSCSAYMYLKHTLIHVFASIWKWSRKHNHWFHSCQAWNRNPLLSAIIEHEVAPFLFYIPNIKPVIPRLIFQLKAIILIRLLSVLYFLSLFL